MSGEFGYRLKSLVACAVSSFLQDIKHVHIHVFVSRAHPSLQVLSFWASTTTSALVSRAWSYSLFCRRKLLVKQRAQIR